MLKDMLRRCVMEFPGSWDRYIPLMEFAYNNSYQSRIDMTPYEALYGQRCRAPVCWTYVNEHKIIGPDIVKDTKEKVQVIQQRLNVTPRPERVYGMCNRMCTKGFLNYFSAIIEFFKVVLRVKL